MTPDARRAILGAGRLASPSDGLLNRQDGRSVRMRRYSQTEAREPVPRGPAKIEGVRIHGLRQSYASGVLLVGEGQPTSGKLLAHNDVLTAAR